MQTDTLVETKPAAPFMKLTIHKDRWCSGRYESSDGRRCAIGHYLAALGKDPAVLSTEVTTVPAEAAWLLNGPNYSRAWERLTNANDREDFKAVESIFWEHGVAVEFVGF